MAERALDLESPGAAFARQARTESQVVALLKGALRSFLVDMRRLVVDDGFALTAGQVAARWRFHVDEAMDSYPVDDQARAYLVEVVAESAVPDDAYAAAIALLTIAHEEAWPASDLRAEAADVFAVDESLTAAGSRRGPRHGANWEALDAAAGGDWMAKMKRDARTAVTGLEGLLTSQALGEQGYTRRRWVTMHDAKVRDAHRAVEGQTVAIGEPFIVGGYPLRYPGDRQAPPELCINCRCVQIGVRWRDPDRLT